MAYDTRAFGDFGWAFVNAGEQYRKFRSVSEQEKLMMCGIFKQATMGDCLVEEARRNETENNQRNEWLKHKGMDPYDAMQLYMDKVKELAQIYQLDEDSPSSSSSSPDEEDEQGTGAEAAKSA